MKKENVLSFINAINASHFGRMQELMSNDHVFIDSQGHKTSGMDSLKKAWIQYFAMFPDYKIEVDEILEKDSLICVLGYASGTYKNMTNSNYWRIPAAWSAIVEDNRIKQWQVYADNIMVMEIVNRNK